MPYNKLDLSDSRHPYRIIAKRIISEIIEFNCPAEYLDNGKIIRMENDIVAILSNLDE